MAPSPSRFGPWDGDPQQAMAIASLLRRVGGTAGVHVYELEVLDGPTYRCRVWIGQAVDSMLGGIPAGMDAEDAWEHCVHPDDRALVFALEELAFFSHEVKILGVYPAHQLRIAVREEERGEA
jgi:hypothetical protein